jgi:hypothetical protein
MVGQRQARLARRWVACALAIVAPTAQATEGGGTVKVLGVETVRAGVMPPPGLRVLTTVGGYGSTRSNDSEGNPRAGTSNFELSVSALTVRAQYVWPQKLWGADVETRVGYTLYADTKLDFDVTTAGGPVHRAARSHGAADALFDPITLGWHFDSFHQIAGLEFYIPTGSFDPTRLANQSRGYWSIAPTYRFTWYPTALLEVSGNLVVLFNLENPDTDYKSGREVSFDYGVGYAFAQTWQAGASGYWYKQISDDEVNGVTVSGGNRGRVVAIGPFIRYHPLSEEWGVTLKWQIEAAARNKTQGNRLYLQIAKQLF